MIEELDSERKGPVHVGVDDDGKPMVEEEGGGGVGREAESEGAPVREAQRVGAWSGEEDREMEKDGRGGGEEGKR
eukprot:502530-Rhodomonas_salina.1